MHHRMGHITVASTRKLVKSGAITSVELDPNSQEHDCDTCIFARATRLPVPKVRISTPAQRFGDEIHTDVWGPASISTHQGRQYFVTFTDDAMHFTITYLMRTKDQALEAYKSFEAWALTQGHYRAIKVLRSDRGGECLSDVFNAQLTAAGTARKLTVHDTPQLNGVAERLNCTLLKRIHAFEHGSGLPKSLWGEALRHAVWSKNRTVTCALDSRTPFEALYGHPPDCPVCACRAAKSGCTSPTARSLTCAHARLVGSASMLMHEHTMSFGQARAMSLGHAPIRVGVAHERAPGLPIGKPEVARACEVAIDALDGLPMCRPRVRCEACNSRHCKRNIGGGIMVHLTLGLEGQAMTFCSNGLRLVQ
jgi:hypothetical protein